MWKINSEKSIVMWKKFDMDLKFDCDIECGFVPPPDFSIPPPPLPPYLKELPKCSEELSSEFEMCSLIPVSQNSTKALKKSFFCLHFNQFLCWEDLLRRDRNGMERMRDSSEKNLFTETQALKCHSDIFLSSPTEKKIAKFIPLSHLRAHHNIYAHPLSSPV